MTASREEALVLCRVGPHRLAIAAASVDAITEDDGAVPWAGRLFALQGGRPGTTRALRWAGGGLGVDAVTVDHQPCPLLPVPVALGPAVRGGVRGFAVVAEALWPVLEPAGLAVLLEAAP